MRLVAQAAERIVLQRSRQTKRSVGFERGVGRRDNAGVVIWQWDAYRLVSYEEAFDSNQGWGKNGTCTCNTKARTHKGLRRSDTMDGIQCSYYGGYCTCGQICIHSTIHSNKRVTTIAYEPHLGTDGRTENCRGVPESRRSDPGRRRTNRTTYKMH